MNVSAQVRYVDYAVRPLHSKNRRRSDEDSVLRRKADPRPEDEPSDDKERQEPLLAFDDDDEGLGYSRKIAARVGTTARKDMIPETVRATPPLQGTAALLTLITAGDGRQRGAGEPVAAKTASRGDAFYDLLDQVISQA